MARLAAAAAAASAAAPPHRRSARCASALNCSLNGVCDRGACVCDKPWSGGACETMGLKPVSFPQGYGMAPRVTTWGGGIVRDGKEHHLFVSRMSNGCQLSAFQTNSRIDHAVSATGAAGPYVFRDVAVGTFSHNAAPVTLRDSTYAIYHVGAGEGGPDGGDNCTARRGGSQRGTGSGAGRALLFSGSRAAAGARVSGGSTIHVSASLAGPWAPLQNTLGHCNNPAPWVHRNGTIFVGCGGVLKRSEHPSGPYTTVASFPMHAGGQGVRGNYEDPQIYTDKRGNFHCLYHVYRYGSNVPNDASQCVSQTVSAHAYSEDGFAWRVAPTQPYGNAIELAGGGAVTVATRERPKPLFGADGGMTHLVTGVCGTPNCTRCVGPCGPGCADCKYNNWDYTLVQAVDV